MSMDDAAAMEFYRDPANQVADGPGHRRKAPRKSSMIAVRFDPAMIEECREHAAAEGMAVSTWIRRAVAARLERPSGLIEGSARLGERKALGSTRTTASGRGGTARCEHMSVGNVTAAACGICGPLPVEYVVSVA